MKHQPRRFQNRYQRAYLRIHPIEARDKQNDTTKNGGQRHGDVTFSAKDETSQHRCPRHVHHGFVGITPRRVSRNVPPQTHPKGLIQKNNHNADDENGNKFGAPLPVLHQLHKCEHKQQTAQNEVPLFGSIENIPLIVSQFRVQFLGMNEHSGIVCALKMLNLLQ